MELQRSKQPESADDIIIFYASDAPEVIIIIYVLLCVGVKIRRERRLNTDITLRVS